MPTQSAITPADAEAARGRIQGIAFRTPLVRCYADVPAELYLKLENLQPIGSFKIRGAANVIANTGQVNGLLTASAGNMAQGVAWAARELGLPATILVPDTAPEAKLAAITRLGGTIRKLPYDEWWRTIVAGRSSHACNRCYRRRAGRRFPGTRCLVSRYVRCRGGRPR